MNSFWVALDEDSNERLKTIREILNMEISYGQPGGALQVLIDGLEVPVKEIYELDTGIKIWPNP